MVMVSYSHGTNRTSLNQWIEASGAPLYNWVPTINLGAWEETESKDFFTGTLEDLGIFLTNDLLNLMVEHSRNIPWILQDMGKRLLKLMGSDPLNVRWPQRESVQKVVLDSLTKVANTIFKDVENAVAASLEEYQASHTETSVAKKEACLPHFWELIQSFAGDINRFADQDPDRLFTFEEIINFMLANPKGKQIGAELIERILDLLNRTIVINGRTKNEYEFTFGLMPMTIRWRKELRKELRPKMLKGEE